MNVISPDISVLDFTVLFDLSGTTPAITLTNASSGAHLNNCHWWYEVKTPSGAFIHQGVGTAPDVNGTWTTIDVTSSYPWPQPFQQIEWGTSPYSVTLYVKDSANTVFSLNKTTTIVRPLGSITTNNNNFGTSKPYLEVKCDNGKIYAEDRTSYTWNGITGVNTARLWTLVYPLDATDTQPDPFVLADAVNGLFPINFSAPGYQLILSSTMRYDYSNGTSVKIKYKSRSTFAVSCDIDLCPLMCDYEAMLKRACSSTCEDKADLDDKIRRISGLLIQALIGKTQPLCGIDVGKIVDEIKEIGGFTCNCTLSGAGVNGSSNSNSALTMSIISDAGDIAGTATVTGANVVVHLSDTSYIFKMCDASDLKTAFTVSSSTSGHTKTFCLNIDQAALVTAIAAALPTPTATCCPIYVSVHMVGTTNAPALCPDSYFPARVYNYGGTAIIGIAQSADHLVSILNANGTWNVKGTAFNAGNCKVGFTPATGITSISHVQVDLQSTGGGGTGTPPCVAGTKWYATPVIDKCVGTPLAVVNYPADFFVQYTVGGPFYSVGTAVDYSDLVALLTAQGNKPSNITYNAIPGGHGNSGQLIDVGIYDADCTANNEVTIAADLVQEVIYGGNYKTSAGPKGIFVEDLAAHSDLGRVCDANIFGSDAIWQIIEKGDYLYAVATNTGHLYKIDKSDPLNPWLTHIEVLPTSPAAGSPPYAPFSGLPNIGGQPSHLDVFFPSDDYSSSLLYILESTAGVLYKYDTLSDTVLDSFYHIKLVGKAPRVVVNNKLYFTWDANRETDAGLTSGIDRADILWLDLTTFAGSALTAVAIGTGDDEPWAMSRDKMSGKAWITTKNGELVEYSLTADTVSHRYSGIWGFSATNRINTTIFNGIIYASSRGIGTKWIDLANLTGSHAFDSFTATQGLSQVTNIQHNNFTPVPGKCYGVVAFDNGSYRGGYARFTLNGQFMNVNYMNDGNPYNGIALVPNTPAHIPNGLC